MCGAGSRGVKVHCQVLVAGGGAAGVAAAVAAARAGAEVLLVERKTFLGGTYVAGLHQQVCGLYSNGPTPSDELLNGGLTAEIVSLLRAANSGRGPIRLGAVDVLPCPALVFAQTLSELAASQKGLTLRLQTAVKSVVRQEGNIAAVELEVAGGNPSQYSLRREGLQPFPPYRIREATRTVGREWLRSRNLPAASGQDQNNATVSREEVSPSILIDCTGEGAVLRLTGAPLLSPPPGERQLAGYTIRITGVRDWNDVLFIKAPYAVRQGIEVGALPAYLKFTTLIRGEASDEAFVKMSYPSAGLRDGLDPRKDAEALHEWLRRNVPEFAQSRLAETSPAILDRDGDRLAGDYVLAESDVLGGVRVPDPAARGAWPVEYWDQVRGPTYRYLRPGDTYDIPLRCLRSSRVPHLLCAGRCISADARAQASVRVAGLCLAIGEAAGLEAARRVRG